MKKLTRKLTKFARKYVPFYAELYIMQRVEDYQFTLMLESEALKHIDKNGLDQKEIEFQIDLCTRAIGRYYNIYQKTLQK